MDSGSRPLLWVVGLFLTGAVCASALQTGREDRADSDPRAAGSAEAVETGPEQPPEAGTGEPTSPQGTTVPWRPFRRPPGFAGGSPWFAPESLLVDWVGHGRARQLREARFQFLLSSGHPSRAADDGWRDPEHLESYEDVVLSAWGKTIRDAFEDALGVEEWWDRKFDRRSGRAVRGDGRSSWHLRVSPRLSEDRLGIKLRLPYTRHEVLDHLSFRVRYDWTEDQTTWILKLDDGARFFHLDFEPDTEEVGDRFSLSVRLAW